MFTIIERFFSVSDQEVIGKFEFYLILRLTFSFTFTAICCGTLSHNFSQEWRENGVFLLRMLHETWQILKHIYRLAFDKFYINKNHRRQPKYYSFCVERKFNLQNNFIYHRHRLVLA